MSGIAFVFGLSSFIKHKLAKADYLLIFIATLFISGSVEPITIITILLASFFIIKIHNKEKKVMALLSLSILITGILIIYFSAGTAKRDALTPSLSILNTLFFAGYGTLKTIFFGVFYHFLPALFLSTPFLILGKQFNKQPIDKKDVVADFIKIIVFVIGLIFVNQLIVIIPLGDLPPERALIASSLLIFCIIIYYFFRWGVLLPNNLIYIKTILLINTIGLFFFVGIFSKTHQNYALHYDKRMEFLTNNSASTNLNKPIYLEKLPPSGYLKSAEITTDTTHFLNKNLKMITQSNKTLILKENNN